MTCLRIVTLIDLIARRALYPAWRGYLGQMERCSKDRLQHFEHLVAVVEQLKQMKTHKHQVVKKTMETYFKWVPFANRTPG